MEVAKISEKSHQNQGKNELRPHIESTTDIISIYHRATRYYVRTEYLVLIDYILSKNTKYQVWSQFNELKIISDLIQMMTKKYHSKILYSIFKLQFASKHYMKRRAGLHNNDWMEKIFQELESHSIIKKIRKHDEDYDIIIKFWTNEFKNTHRKKVVDLYHITKEFQPVIQAFSNTIEDRYFSRPELTYLYNLRKRYELYADGVRKNLKLAQSENAKKLGNCIECGRIIRKGEKKGTGGYHKFNAGLVCHQCKVDHIKTKGKEWTRKNK